MEPDRIAMRAPLLERVGDLVEVGIRLVSDERTGNPPEAPIGDHHERPSRTPSIQISSVGDVFAPPDGDHALAEQQMAAEIRVAGLQKLLEAGHSTNGIPGSLRSRP